MADDIVETSFNGEVNEPEVTPELPSEVVPETNFVPEGFDDFVKENTSDNGKLYGQFDNVQQALEHFREQEVKHTNNMRELKDAQKGKQEEVKSVKEELETTIAQQDGLKALIPEFISNDMVITDEMSTKIEELGLDVRDIKLEAYSVKEKANAMKTVAFDTVGGETEYVAMMEWANVNLDEATKADFQKSLEGMQDNQNIGALAIRGLHSMYKNGADIPNTPRVEGYSKPNDVVRGYTSQDELFADRRASQKNPVLKEKYLKRLSMTDDKVLTLY